MKNQFTSRIVKLTFAFLFVLIASSCSQDDEVMDAAALAKEINNEAAAKGVKVSTAVTYTSSITGIGSTFCVDDAQTFTLSGWNGSAQLNVQIYDASILDWVSIDSFNAQLTSPQSLSYTFPAAGVYSLRYQVSGNAANGGTNGYVYFNVTAINCGCDESFSYVDNGNGSYTFTYISEVELIDAEVKFTTPHITGYTAGDAKTYTVNPANPNVPGNQTVLTWTGDIAACTPITFTLSFSPDCIQNASGKLNLWTDFKVNSDSKKGTLENIKYDCN